MVIAFVVLITMIGSIFTVSILNRPIDLERRKTYKLVAYPLITMTAVYLVYTVGVSLENLNYPRLATYYMVLLGINWFMALLVKYYDKKQQGLLKTVACSISLVAITVLAYGVYLNYTGVDSMLAKGASSKPQVIKVTDEGKEKIKELESIVANGKYTKYCTDAEASKYIPSCYGTYEEFIKKTYEGINTGDFLNTLNYKKQEIEFLNKTLDELDMKLAFLADLRGNITLNEQEAKKRIETDIGTLTVSYNQLTEDFNKKLDLANILNDLGVHNFNYMMYMGWVKDEKYTPITTEIAEFASIEPFDLATYAMAYTAVLPLEEKSLEWVQKKIEQFKNGENYEIEETEQVETEQIETEQVETPQEEIPPTEVQAEQEKAPSSVEQPQENKEEPPTQ